MKIIKAVLVGDVYDYAEPVPEDAVYIAFDGANEVFIVRQSGDPEPEPEVTE
jgi:hypothetical protein